MILTESEVVELTKRTRRPAQARVLRFMGIEHRIRPDGSVAVLRAHVDKILGGGEYTNGKVTEREPDWSAI